MFIKTGFEGIIGVCKASELLNNVCASQAIPQIVDENITAPLPDFGVYANYEFISGWDLTTHAQYFYINLNDVKGELVDIKLGIDAQITPNWRMIKLPITIFTTVLSAPCFLLATPSS